MCASLAVATSAFAIAKHGFDFVVGVDGDFKAAIAAAGSSGASASKQFVIFLPDGEYELTKLTADSHGKTTVSASFVSIIGQSLEKTVISNKTDTESIGHTATLYFTKNNGVYMQDITLQNKSTFCGQNACRQVALQQNEGDKFTFKNVVEALKETAETTAMIFLIMIGSDILSQFFTMTNISSVLGTIAANAASPWIILIVFLLIYGLLGCFIDSLPLICLLTPIFLPVIRMMGFNEMWFGVLMVMLMELGLMTPPVGMCCYVMAGITKGTTSLQQIFKGTAPFLIGITVAIIIVMLCPSLATWLPGLMRG